MLRTVFRLFCVLVALGLPSLLSAQSLRAGDRIAVTLRDTTEVATLRADGTVILPVVGALSLAGLTPVAAEDSVIRAYAAFTRRPDVRVMALRRVTVQGAVRRADVLYVDATVGLAEALALAGGVSETGHFGKVDLFRDGVQVGRFDARTPATLSVPIHSGDLILVRERSWWARNPSAAVSIIASLVTVVVVLGQ